ncbi:MAG: DNA repair protein RecN [Gammaproteobacteria bacterium]
MLRHLYIRNFAVVEELELEFGEGMSVFTGETGAGKSILIDALGLVLGDRADTDVIRGGADRSEIAAAFEYPGDGPVAEMLAAQDLAAGTEELILRRVIGSDGRSRGFINTAPVPAQVLRDVGEQLVDIQGQHAHQLLLKRDMQRALLDEFGNYKSELAAVRGTCEEWRSADHELAAIAAGGGDHESAIALLRYQVEELAALNLKAGEFQESESEYRRLSNASRIRDTLGQSLAALYEDDGSAYSRIGSAAGQLKDLGRFDPGLEPINALLEAASIQLSEAVEDLRRYLEGLELDAGRLSALEQRLDQIQDTARKHQIRPEQLTDHFLDLQARLRDLEGRTARAGELEQRRAAAMKQYATASASLHQSRMQAADTLALAVSSQLHELGMPGGRFVINVAAGNTAKPQAHGIDEVEFNVTVNPGQPARPLAKVASGGELSRISLAIQVIGSRGRGSPTLIFDEVDAGIGGGIAEIVGRLLHRLADRRQVICVTHLPQVASQGDHHFQVNKSSTKNSTSVQVTELGNKDRVEEIARMLGGVRISDQSRAHAREMLKNLKN